MEYPKPISNVDDLPKNYGGLERERHWQQYWDSAGVYLFEPRRPDGNLRTRDEIFSVDTPPPTVSGALHIGHVYSYTQTDMNVRYQRMKGLHVYYPFGFDDNGLPTERLVERITGKRAHEVGREEFIELCKPIVADAEGQFKELWQSLALSCDWSEQYSTISEKSRAISQASFIDLYKKGIVYRKVAPTQWDWVNQTAIAQAEIEDREVAGHFHDIRFGWTSERGGKAEGELTIATTRPELIPACVAVLAHPEDSRYQHLFGKLAITPLFGVEVPILPSEKADPEKGTGILMCCTFGDQEDVEHWQKFNLPTRVIIDKDGKIKPLGSYVPAKDFDARLAGTERYARDRQESLGENWPTADPERAGANAGQLQGLKIKQAREKIRELLQESGELLAVKDIMHAVRHAERGDVPVEILVTPQWYVNILDYKDALIEQGRRIDWHPAYMRKRYEQWVEGLNGDWCISRQRFSGVPFPVWYDEESQPLLADALQLPVNPLVDTMPTGASQPDPDVMDTWATSSVTPLLNTGWRFEASMDEARAKQAQIFPFDLRPQAHDIIRTWAFYTIAKSLFHFGMEEDSSGKWVVSSDEAKLKAALPWTEIVISGHAQDAGGKKMSKSKGNIVTPMEMVEKYSADGLRYWSGSVKLGTDTVYDERNLTEGRKLINKIFNATKFALRHLLDFDPGESGGGTPPLPGTAGGPARDSALAAKIVYPSDRWLIARLNETIARATKANEEFEFGDAKQAVEDFFWAELCDNYLEFSKGRLYGEPLAVSAHSAGASGEQYSAEQLRESAQATLYIALSSVLRMFAPILPHITEECWSWYFAQHSDKRSIHVESWPQAVALAGAGEGAEGELLLAVVAAVRKWKSEQSVSVKKPLSSLKIYVTEHAPKDSGGNALFNAAALSAVLGDLQSTCNAQSAELAVGAAPSGAGGERAAIVVDCVIAEEEEGTGE